MPARSRLTSRTRSSRLSVSRSSSMMLSGNSVLLDRVTSLAELEERIVAATGDDVARRVERALGEFELSGRELHLYFGARARSAGAATARRRAVCGELVIDELPFELAAAGAAQVIGHDALEDVGPFVAAHPAVRFLEVVDGLRDRLVVGSLLEAVELLTQDLARIHCIALLHVVGLLANDVGFDRYDVESDRRMHVDDVLRQVALDLRAVVIGAGQPFADAAEVRFA